MTLFRISLLLGCLLVLPAWPGAAQDKTAAVRDGQHDFDFEIGSWKTHLWRLQRPLTHSKEWVEYEGTTVVRKVWDGRANLVELDVTGPAGHIEALSLRLYNPQSGQWSLNFASSRGGTMATADDRRIPERPRRVLRPGDNQRPGGAGAFCHLGRET